VRLDLRAIDHLDVVRATASGKLADQSLSHTAFRPADELIVDRRARPELRLAML